MQLQGMRVGPVLSGELGWRFVTTFTDETAAELPCANCGYDLRATPPDGTCPECAATVVEARRLAAIPRRPAWRDSDPRWRRRILAGAWTLVLLPLMDALRAFGVAAHIPMPTVVGSHDPIRTLDATFLFWPGVYQMLVFCVGIALLFSKERGRQRGRWDWTRRWGVLCSYVTLLLAAAPMLFITALVFLGISALFISMPPKYQPGVTDWLLRASATYLRYGPQPKQIADVVLVAFSCITVLLACAPLFDALRSTGPKRLGGIVLIPLALFALLHLAQAAAYALDTSATPKSNEILRYGVYFRPGLVLDNLAAIRAGLTNLGGPALASCLVEIAKWCAVLMIAVWLTVARFVRRRGPA